jgi:hypothetical protein
MSKVPYEVIKESYHLKSTFFYNNLSSRGYFELFMQIQTLNNIEGNKLNWAQREHWKICDFAWEALKRNNISPMIVFLHPKILQLHPSFLKYYRSVALLPQKGLKAISGVSSVDSIESGKIKPGKLTKETVDKLVSSINEVISLVVSLSADINENEIQGMMYATAGTNIDGSWRNSIGTEGERVIRVIILRELLLQNEVSSTTDRQNKTKSISGLDLSDILDAIDEIRLVNLINGYSVLFGSEPDITLIDDESNVVGVIEVKAGLDPAGALERLGAMFKSFDNTLAEYPNAVTVLVASCITDEVDSRIGASMSIRQKYITTDITSSDSNQRKFANRVRRIIKLTK